MACDDPAPVENSFRGTGCPLRRFEQSTRILFRAALAENRVAGDQQLGSRFDDARDRVVSNTAVYLNPITKAQFPSKFFQAANLAEGVRE